MLGLEFCCHEFTRYRADTKVRPLTQFSMTQFSITQFLITQSLINRLPVFAKNVVVASIGDSTILLNHALYRIKLERERANKTEELDAL